MKLFFCFVAAMLLVSCNNNSSEQKEPFKSLLKNCDEVKINFYNGGDTVHFETKDSLGIRYLTQNVSGNTETVNDTCKTVGDLYYRAKGDTLLRAEFAVMPATKRDQCAYISYSYQNQSYKNKLSEKIYQLFTQMNVSVDSTRHLRDSLQKIQDTMDMGLDSLNTN
jgi:hypothetical protein